MKSGILPAVLVGLVCAGCAHVTPPMAIEAARPALVAAPGSATEVAATSEVTTEVATVGEVADPALAASQKYGDPAEKFSGVAEKKDNAVASAGIRVTGGFKRFNDDQPEYFDPNDPFFVPEDGGTKSDSEIYLYDKFRDRPTGPVTTAPTK